MNYILLSYPRSGSSYLSSCLLRANETPNMLFSEPFVFDYLKMRARGEDNCHIKMSKEEQYRFIKSTNEYIIKLHWYKEHFQFYNFDAKVILLLRRNIFETTCSLCLSKIHNLWFNYDIKDTYIPLDIFKVNLLFLLNTINSIVQEKYDKVIYYEDLTFNVKNDIKALGFTCHNSNNSHIKSPDKEVSVKNLKELKDEYYNIISTEDLAKYTFIYIENELISIRKI